MPLGSSSAAPVMRPGPEAARQARVVVVIPGVVALGGASMSAWRILWSGLRRGATLWHGLCTRRADPQGERDAPDCRAPGSRRRRPTARTALRLWQAACRDRARRLRGGGAGRARRRADHARPDRVHPVRALFPSEPLRRRFLQAVGAGTARAAIASLFPLGALEAMAAEPAPLEKKDLKIGFIPITCATPLIMADPLGFYREQGLNVAAHQDGGLGADPRQDAQQGVRRLALPVADAARDLDGRWARSRSRCTWRRSRTSTARRSRCAIKHKDKRDPKQWKGFKFAVPFEYSMHNFLLRYYLAEARPRPGQGHPDPRRAAARDGRQPARRQHRRLPRPRSVQPARGLRRGRLHPPAVQGDLGRPPVLRVRHAASEFIKENPNTFAALYRAVLTAADDGARPEEPRADRQGDRAAELPEPARDGDRRRCSPASSPTAWATSRTCPTAPTSIRCRGRAMAVWILTQMKRWGYIKGDVDYKADRRAGVPADRRQEAA